MWREVAAAALVGLALSDGLLCIFMGASFAGAGRRLGLGFLAGRTVGVLGLLLAVGTVGAALLDGQRGLALAFAASSIAVAVVIAVSAARPSVLSCCPERRSVSGLRPRLAADGAGCAGDCASCGASHDGAGATTSRWSPSAWLRRRFGRDRPLLAGLALGAVRGATPCLKVAILVPLLVVSPPATVGLMALAYVATSSAYPVIGILAGDAVHTALGGRRAVRLAGAAGVGLVGAWTLWRLATAGCALWA